ncbi:MAG TPA: lysylphosphatidylglycerol synthase domain-containing protein [Thermomicrobiales bacterium]|nr:lysylphosphatidylglycerol synthase domain-containing protein [Thermomicrobiales bacterium]
MATETALPATASTNRRRWVSWLAAICLCALVAVVAFSPGLRDLAASTWREMLSISPLLLALIVALKIGQALFSGLVWRNALLCAWPNSPLPYGFVLGVEQGQIAVNTVMPARVGTWAMLGIFAYSIRGVRPAKLIAVWAVQSLAFGVFAAINYIIIAAGIPGQEGNEGPTDVLAGFVSDRPLAAGAAGAGVVIVAGFALFLGRRRLAAVRHQILEGLAIVRPPVRYVRLLLLPSLASYAFSVASYVVLLAAFDIPVTVFTVALALGSNALGGAVRITPGGLGTSQALDVIALTAFAPAGVVTAFSLSEIAITLVVSVGVAVVALILSTGRHGTRRLIGQLRSGDLGEGLHARHDRQRPLRQRAKRPGGRKS